MPCKSVIPVAVRFARSEGQAADDHALEQLLALVDVLPEQPSPVPHALLECRA